MGTLAVEYALSHKVGHLGVPRSTPSRMMRTTPTSMNVDESKGPFQKEGK